MALFSPLKINALILRATPGRGRVWFVQCFSDQLGRISFSAIPRQGGSFSPFCLIEATICPQANDFAMAKEIEILDTFSELRSHPEASKGALLLRAIVEKCLPMHAPAHDVWQLFLSLLELLPSFHDWKAAPLLLAFTFFEHEGVSPRSIIDLPTLTSEEREVARHLLEANETAWRKAKIPDNLFTAAMETIGVERLLQKPLEENAKGGT